MQPMGIWFLGWACARARTKVRANANPPGFATADRQEPTEALAAKTAHLKEKIAKIGEEMKKLDAIEKQMLASPDQQISLTDPDARSMATSGRGSGMVGYNVQIWISTRSSLRGDAKIRRAVAEVCSVMLPDCHELVVFGHGEGFAHRAVEAVDDRLPSMTSAVPIIGVLRIVPLIVLRKPTADRLGQPAISRGLVASQVANELRGWRGAVPNQAAECVGRSLFAVSVALPVARRITAAEDVDDQFVKKGLRFVHQFGFL